MKFFRLLSLLLLSATLTSCATFKSPFDNSDPLIEFMAKPPRNGKGLVSLLVTPNSGKIDWQQAVLIVRKVTARGRYNGQPIRLLPVPLSTSDETVAYVGKLFPGRYSVVEMSQTRLVGDFQAVTDVISVSKEGDPDALVFEVASDKHTDAGRLLVSSVGDSWVGAWSSDRLARDDIERGNEPVADYLSGFTSTAAVERADGHAQVQALMTRSPAGAFDIQRQTKQGIVAGSRLASILRRDEAGNWQRKRVGQFRRVLSLSSDASGRLLFAGEDRLLGYQFAKKAAGNEALKFRYISTKGIPSGQFVKLYWSEGRGLMVLHQDGAMVRLFATHSLNKPKWQLLAEVPQSDDVPEGVFPAWLEVAGDYMAMAVFPNTVVTSGSPGSDLIASTTPDDISEFRLRRGGLLQILTLNRRSGSVVARESVTGGASWDKFDIAPRTAVLPVQVGGDELSIREQRVDDDRFAARLLRKGGQEGRWQPGARMPVGRFYAVDSDHLFVVGAGFEVIRTDDSARVSGARDFVAFSADGGESWVKEREQ